MAEGLNTFTITGSGFDPGVPTWTLLCPLASGLTEDSPEDELAAAMASVTSDDCDLSTSTSVTFDDEGSFTTEREAIVIANFMWVASDAAETQVAAAAVFMEAPEPEPEPEPTPTSVPVVVDDPGIDDRALAFLAGELGVPESEIALTGTEAVAWADASLGCPKEGYAYAQVLTPGYRFTFTYGTASHDVHTDEQGTHFVRPVGCYDPTAAEPTTTTQPEPEPEPTPTTTPPEEESTTTTLPEPAPEENLSEATLAVLHVLDDLLERALDLWNSGHKTQACGLVDEARTAAKDHLGSFGADALAQDARWVTWMEHLASWEARCADRGPDLSGYEPGEVVNAAELWPDNDYGPNYVCQANNAGSLVDADGSFNCWTQEPPWTPPQAGDVPTVHPDTPPREWHLGEINPTVRPRDEPRWTQAVDQWWNWCDSSALFIGCARLLNLMHQALDYLGARPECVLGAYTGRVNYSNSAPNSYSENYGAENHGWHLCATVIDPIITDLPSPLPENDVGYRLSDTPGITLAERCRAVLTIPFPDIELESRWSYSGNRPPTEFGQDCDAWAAYIESRREYRIQPQCEASMRLAEEWMEHHHGQPERYFRPEC